MQRAHRTCQPIAQMAHETVALCPQSD